MFIMIDGIDGSGKGTIISAWKEYLTSQGNAIFDLKKYWEEKNQYPSLDEIKSYDIIFSCEPTRTGIGQAIRKELINKNNHYPARAIAEAYSLDRLILYTKIIIPLLQDEKMIVQDRGISTSLAYQTGQGLNYEEVSNLVGNQLALKHSPNFLILVDTPPAVCAQRLTGRTNQKDNAIFEQTKTLQLNAEQFKKPVYQNIFTARGTKILTLNGGENIDIMKTKAIELFQTIIKQ